jgi:gliding motility-associated-like protein
MPLNVIVNQDETFDTVYIKKGEVYELGEEVYNESGDYLYSTKSKNGCDSIIHLHLVVGEEPVVVTLEHNSPVCEGMTFEAEAMGVPDDATLLWHTPKGQTSEQRKFKIKNVQLSDAGLYSLTVSLADGKKMDPIDVLVEVNPSYMVYDTVMVERGGFYEQDGDVYEAGNDYQIKYQTVMGCDSVVNLHLAEKEEEKPDVEEEEKPETPEEELPDGEQEEKPNDETKEVPEKEQPEVDLPEEGEEEVTLIPSPIFSPNEDGINDLWEIDGIEKFPDAKVEIYDRFGKLLSSYEGYENDKGWDGTYNGEKLPSTDYWYVITVHAISKVYYGHFTLVRR